MTLKLSIGTPVVTMNPRSHAAWEETASIEDVARIAEAADRLDYHHMTCSEHVALPAGELARRGSRYWDPLATFGYLAARTSRIRFTTHVLVLGYHHPLEIAKRYGTLDKVSNGRLILGVGVGSLKEEFDLIGAPFDQRGRGPTMPCEPFEPRCPNPSPRTMATSTISRASSSTLARCKNESLSGWAVAASARSEGRRRWPTVGVPSPFRRPRRPNGFKPSNSPLTSKSSCRQRRGWIPSTSPIERRRSSQRPPPMAPPLPSVVFVTGRLRSISTSSRRLLPSTLQWRRPSGGQPEHPCTASQ